MKKLSKLIENDLDQAELVLAAKSMAQDLQDMTEKVAKMRVDDLLPLVDRIKETFDQATGEQYQRVVDGELEKLQNELTVSKDVLDNQANILNGDVSGDMGMGLDDVDATTDMDMEVDTDVGVDIDPELEIDPFAAADANAGGVEPMGRAQKESIEKKHKALVEEYKVLKKKLKKLKAK